VSRYILTDEDLKYAAEFKANPLGSASPGLQRVMNLMRGGPKDGKYVLVVKVPHKRWFLGQLPAERGQPIKVLEEEEFTDLAVAEWIVFRRRWRDHTGRDLDKEL
tara:strand:+ start:562 stop:876 length:315 start_codon:yes stop_codon:yes gene_type:complete